MDVSEVERPIQEYATLNEFFARWLRPGTRPIFMEGCARLPRSLLPTILFARVLSSHSSVSSAGSLLSRRLSAEPLLLAGGHLLQGWWHMHGWIGVCVPCRALCCQHLEKCASLQPLCEIAIFHSLRNPHVCQQLKRWTDAAQGRRRGRAARGLPAARV